MTWKVESITEADIEDLHELFSDAGPYVSARTLSDYWLYARLFSGTCLCVRGDTGKPIAALIAFRDQTEDINEIYIQDVAVGDDYRRRGYGEALLSALRTTATTSGIKRIWLTSEDANEHATRLWTKLGYQNPVADYQHDSIWITKDLKGAGRDRAIYELRLRSS